MARSTWLAKQNPEAPGNSRGGTNYPHSSQHQVETEYRDLLAAGRHPLVDTGTTTFLSGNHGPPAGDPSPDTCSLPELSVYRDNPFNTDMGAYNDQLLFFNVKPLS